MCQRLVSVTSEPNNANVRSIVISATSRWRGLDRLALKVFETIGDTYQE